MLIHHCILGLTVEITGPFSNCLLSLCCSRFYCLTCVPTGVIGNAAVLWRQELCCLVLWSQGIDFFIVAKWFIKVHLALFVGLTLVSRYAHQRDLTLKKIMEQVWESPQKDKKSIWFNSMNLLDIQRPENCKKIGPKGSQRPVDCPSQRSFIKRMGGDGLLMTLSWKVLGFRFFLFAFLRHLPSPAGSLESGWDSDKCSYVSCVSISLFLSSQDIALHWWNQAERFMSLSTSKCQLIQERHKGFLLHLLPLSTWSMTSASPNVTQEAPDRSLKHAHESQMYTGDLCLVPFLSPSLFSIFSVFWLVSPICPWTVDLTSPLIQFLACVSSNNTQRLTGTSETAPPLALPRQDLTLIAGFPAEEPPVSSFSLIYSACDGCVCHNASVSCLF